MWIDEFDPRKIKPGYELPVTNDRIIAGLHVAPFYIKDRQFLNYVKIIANVLQSGQL